ncbi:hypothetical protein F3G17_28740, partial [Klebsiella pneumoniae]
MEWAFLVLVARFDERFFRCIKRWDDKCGGDYKFNEKLKLQVSKSTVFSIVSVILDVAGLYFIGVKPPEIIILSVAFSVHDAELNFVALLAEAINMRLADL